MTTKTQPKAEDQPEEITLEELQQVAEDEAKASEANGQKPAPFYAGMGVTSTMLEALHADTPDEEVHYRQALKSNGQPVLIDGEKLMLAYVTARYVQDRLDSVLGPQNWQNTFVDLPTGAVRCGIGILVLGDEGAEWIWKYDVGVPSNIEPEKGAHSDAFKRAGVLWGVARDLYDERDDDQPKATVPPEQTPQPQGTVRQQVGEAQVVQPSPITEAQGQGIATTSDEPSPGWMCPIHNDRKVIPAGFSQRTQKNYPAFAACPVPGCTQKPPRR